MTERQRRVMAVWNWLPAVRVVAEYESIQRAARELAVSPSALSRTIKLAEEAVGVALFVRGAAGITVTAAGAALLASVRTAMRTVDDGLEALLPLAGARFVASYTGPVSERLLAGAVAALVVELGPARPSVVELRHIAPADVEAELLRGHVDFALGDGPPLAGPEIVTTGVVDVPFAFYGRDPHADPQGPCVRLVGAEGALIAGSLDGLERAAVEAGLRAELPVCAAPTTFTYLSPSDRTARLHATRRRTLDERTSLSDRLIALVRLRSGG
jgi:DNA-binding transcriptional LysR family regulator